MPTKPYFLSQSRGANATVIIGAGPAGLSAANELSKGGLPVTVLEQHQSMVGGIARTETYKGFRFDIGGHRFFSKNRQIEDLWTEILGERMIERDRLSRIYYRGRFFKYPLETRDVIANLGVVESAACVMSYLRARLRPLPEARTFEGWVTNAFGRRLYEMFFRSYTEKVWGIPCNEISADWAAQRIKDLSMRTLIRRALTISSRKNGPVIKSLIDRFRYPELGPGQMWETLGSRLQNFGVELKMGESVVAVARKAGRVASVTTTRNSENRTYLGDHFISTMPIRELIRALEPAAPDRVIAAAEGLRYRDFITVALIVDEPNLFPDQWIYIHEPGVRVGRIQNFKNWSAAMVPEPRYTVLGLEYFCFTSDGMWSLPDAQLLSMGARELQSLGLTDQSTVIDGTVVRQRAAYPVYDGNYRNAINLVREFIEAELPNLQLAGRNGMHKYNNQDHAMMTGMMAAWNVLGGSYNQWRVNADALYLEEGDEAETARLIPRRVNEASGSPAA